MKIGQPASSIEVWDEGTYPAKILSHEETESTFPGSEGKPRIKWVLQLVNADGDTSEVWYYTNATLSAHKLATLRPLVRAVLPDLDLDDPQLEVDTNNLNGKRCRVLLGINHEKGRNVIEKVLPAEPRKVTKPAERQPVAAGAAAAEDESVPF
jgi:hypothetical protein